METVYVALLIAGITATVDIDNNFLSRSILDFPLDQSSISTDVCGHMP